MLNVMGIHSGDIDTLREYDECIYSPMCGGYPSEKPTFSPTEDGFIYEECTYAMIGNTPWVITKDNKYCASFYHEYISGYLTCNDIDDELYWTIYNSTDCNGYSQTIKAELAFGNIEYYNCRGSDKYCNIIYVNQNQYNSSNPDYPVPSEEKCIEIAKDDPMTRFPIVVKELIHCI